VLLLEALREYETIDATCRRCLKEEYGFTEDEIDEGLAELLDMEMIDERRISDRRALRQGIQAGTDNYGLTLKGKYYVGYMIYWDEYIAAFGVSKHHEMSRDDKAVEVVRRTLLQCLWACHEVRSGAGLIGDFKVSKVALVDFVTETAAEILLWFGQTDRRTPVSLDVDRATEVLTALKVISTTEIENYRSFLVLASKLRAAAGANHVDTRLSPPFVLSVVSEFVGKHVRTPDYDE
jgi:hypothetical protein